VRGEGLGACTDETGQSSAEASGGTQGDEKNVGHESAKRGGERVEERRGGWAYRSEARKKTSNLEVGNKAAGKKKKGPIIWRPAHGPICAKREDAGVGRERPPKEVGSESTERRLAPLQHRDGWVLWCSNSGKTSVYVYLQIVGSRETCSPGLFRWSWTIRYSGWPIKSFR